MSEPLSPTRKQILHNSLLAQKDNAATNEVRKSPARSVKSVAKDDGKGVTKSDGFFHFANSNSSMPLSPKASYIREKVKINQIDSQEEIEANEVDVLGPLGYLTNVQKGISAADILRSKGYASTSKTISLSSSEKSYSIQSAYSQINATSYLSPMDRIGGNYTPSAKSLTFSKANKISKTIENKAATKEEKSSQPATKGTASFVMHATAPIAKEASVKIRDLMDAQTEAQTSNTMSVGDEVEI